MVNTVALVRQQAAYIRRHTRHCVGEYSGDMNVDFWSKEKWQEEFSNNQVGCIDVGMSEDSVFLGCDIMSFVIPDFWRLIWCNYEGKNFVSTPKCPDQLWNPPRPIFNYYQGHLLLYYSRMPLRQVLPVTHSLGAMWPERTVDQ